jgi:hypothetical protein
MCSLAPGSTRAVTQRSCSTKFANVGCDWSGDDATHEEIEHVPRRTHVCHGATSRSCFAKRTGSTAPRIQTSSRLAAELLRACAKIDQHLEEIAASLAESVGTRLY